MPHDPKSTLENDHVRMEPLCEAHRARLRGIAEDPDLWRYASLNQSGRNFDLWMDARLVAMEDKGDFTWTIFDKHTEEPAGSTSFLEVAPAHRRLEIGWTWYQKKFWGSAVNPACKSLLFEYGFDQLGCHRIELKLDAANIRSFRAVTRLGARFEGIHRAHMVLEDRRIRDTAWFSVLKEEWPSVRAGLATRLASYSQ